MKTTDNLEQAVIKTLEDLPVPIVITTSDDETSRHRYVWCCLEGAGGSSSLDGAMHQALNFLIGRLGYAVVLGSR